MPEEAEEKHCFFIAPIGDTGSSIRDRSDKVLEFIIRPAVKKFGYKVQRADDISAPGIITEQVVERIKSDHLVIADLTGGNANVFYELAIRHAVNKPTIQIIEQDDHIPFDVFGMRTIKFDHQDLRSASECIDAIGEAIEATQKNDYRVFSPLSGPLNLDSLGTEGTEGTEGELARLVTQLIAAVQDQGRQLQRLSGASRHLETSRHFGIPPEAHRRIDLEGGAGQRIVEVMVKNIMANLVAERRQRESETAFPQQTDDEGHPQSN